MIQDIRDKEQKIKIRRHPERALRVEGSRTCLPARQGFFPFGKLRVRMTVFIPCVLMFLSLMPCFTPSAFANTVWQTLEEISVQQGGRIKPFQSFATEVARQVTGETSYENYEATEFVWRWMAEPDKWNQTAMIPVEFRPLREEFGVMLVDHKLSPEILLHHEEFLAKVQVAQERKAKQDDLTRIQKERIDLYEKALLFHQIATGRMPSWIANPEDPRVGWLAFSEFGTEAGQRQLARLYPAKEVREVNEAIKGLLVNINECKDTACRVLTGEVAQTFKQSLQNLFESKGVRVDQKLIDAELTYNRFKPFAWSWKIYLLAVVLMLTFNFRRHPERSEGSNNGDPSGFTLRMTIPLIILISGFLIHTYGFVLRCIISGRPPVSNMYESVIWVSWAVVLFAIIIYLFYRGISILITSGFVASFALLISESFPVVLNPAISPLVPVLRSTLWLSVHVLTITLSYGAFALAWGLGHILIFKMAFGKSTVGAGSPRPGAETAPLQQKAVAQYLYRALQIGVILLATGTVLGGVWANYSWGRFWGWDPKETWALIALLGYIAVLHGRLTGWIRTFGLAVGAVSAFLLVIMAWYGVNFVLAAGLHSYGFGGGGAPYVLAVCLADLALVGWASLVYRKKLTTPGA